MATVIDALLVTLGFDARNFARGTQQGKTGLAGVKAAATETGKEVDLATKRMAAGFARVRTEILGLYALITAGRGIKTLIGDLVTGDAAVGRFAANVGMSTENVSAWQKVVERAGGSAQEFTQTAGQLSQALQQYHLTGNSPIAQYFIQMGVALRDVNTGKMREVDDLLRDMAEWAGKHPELSQARKLAVFAGAGVTGATAQALLQGRAALDRQLEEQRKLGGTRPEDAKRAQQLNDQLVQLQTAFEELMRRVVAVVTPTILKVMQSLTTALQDNMPKISAAIDEFAKRIEAFDWSGLITNAGNFATEADKVATALGGWVKITETLFALWAVGKVLGLVGGITRVGLAIAGVGLGGGGGGALAGGGLLGRFALGAAATGGVALSVLGLLGFDPRKLLPRTLQDALGTGRPDEGATTPAGQAPDGSSGDRRRDRDAYVDVPDQRTPLERARLSDEQLDAPGRFLGWLGGLIRQGGLALGAGAGQGEAPHAGFTPAQKEDLFLRFQQFEEERERASRAVAAARLIVQETARGDIARAGPGGGVGPGVAPPGGGDPGNSNVRPSDAAQRAYAFWLKKGYSPAGAAGLVARMMLESRGDPRARGDNGTAFGLFQHHGNRADKMRNATGIDVRTASFDDQLEAFYQEQLLGLDPATGQAYAEVKNATDPAVAGATVSLRMIRPGMTAAKRQAEAAQTARDAMRYQGMYGPGGSQVGPRRTNAAPSQFAPFTPGALRVANTNNQSASADNSTSVTTGNITINTQATDAGGIARDFDKELKRRAFSNQANVGLR